MDLGMTVAELATRMTVAELVAWKGWYQARAAMQRRAEAKASRRR